MYVEVAELGERPQVLTKARRFAPQGARMFGEVLEHCSFADAAIVALDWENAFGLLPPEHIYPVLYIRVFKTVNDGKPNPRLTVDARLDVEDIFGRDEATADEMVRVIAEMEAKANEYIAARKEG